MFQAKITIDNTLPAEDNNYIVLEVRYAPTSPQPEDKLMEVFADLADNPLKKIVAETTQNGSEKITILKIVDA